MSEKIVACGLLMFSVQILSKFMGIREQQDGD
jgi:hypothetical protein